MDPSTISLLAQIPLVGIFVWFTLHRDKLAAQERATRDEAWQSLFTGAEESQTKIAEGHVAALREIAREHREAQERIAAEARASEARILEGQAKIRQGNSKIAALLVARMTGMEQQEARAFVRELLTD